MNRNAILTLVMLTTMLTGCQKGEKQPNPHDNSRFIKEQMMRRQAAKRITPAMASAYMSTVKSGGTTAAATVPAVGKTAASTPAAPTTITTPGKTPGSADKPVAYVVPPPTPAERLAGLKAQRQIEADRVKTLQVATHKAQVANMDTRLAREDAMKREGNAYRKMVAERRTLIAKTPAGTHSNKPIAQ